MNIQQFQKTAEAAIRSNFKMRNARVYTDRHYQLRIQGVRRIKIREWIAALRIARNPVNSERLESLLLWRVA